MRWKIGELLIDLLLVLLIAVLVHLAFGVLPASAATEGDQAAAAAETRVGRPYSWGATGPYAFDCSGLTTWAYRQAGINTLPRVSADQWHATNRVSRSDLRPGDLVFWSYGCRNGCGRADHVGVYVGNGQVVDARGSTGGVTRYPLSSRTYALVGYGRVPGLTLTVAAAPAPELRPLRAGEVPGDRGLDTDRTLVRRRVRAIRANRLLDPDYASDQIWAVRIRDDRTHHLGDARIAITRKAEVWLAD